MAIVEGEEHRLRARDYLHCPPGTAHITIGAGGEPRAPLAVGARSGDATIDYPVEPAAARCGASVERPSDSPAEVDANRPPSGRDLTSSPPAGSIRTPPSLPGSVERPIERANRPSRSTSSPSSRALAARPSRDR